MTRNNIIRIAKQTAENGTYEIHMIHYLVAGTWLKFICDFGEQVAAAEREACAKVAEERLIDKANCTAEQMYEMLKTSIAEDIRARGNHG